MATTLLWHREHDPERLGLKPFAPVLSLVSLTSRNCRTTQLIPSHLTALRKQGVAARLINAHGLTVDALGSCRVLLVEGAPCLAQTTADVMATFVRQGGTLVASPETGLYDEIGRPRLRSALWEALGLPRAPERPTSCGRGEVMLWPAKLSDLGVRLDMARFVVTPQTDATLLPYIDAQGRLIVYVCASKPLPPNLCVTAPGGAPGRAIICSPDEPHPRVIDLVGSAPAPQP